MRNGPRVYNLFPSLVGTVDAWRAELPRIAGMDFNWVFVNPFHQPGFSGSLYAVKDYFRLNPLLDGSSDRPPERILGDFVRDARGRGLDVMMDLVINHTSKDAELVTRHPEWYARDAQGEIVSPHAVDPDDPGKKTVWGDLAEIDYAPHPARQAIVDYWRGVVEHYVKIGFRGFRCDAAYKVPAEVWKAVIEAARAIEPDVVFAAETLGCRPHEIEALRPAGFDFLFNSSKWWDFRSPWALEQYEINRHIAPSIGFPESHDTPRLVEDLQRDGIRDPALIEAAYRQRYLFAALFSSGVMMPIGYEFGWRRKLDVVTTRPDQKEPARFDLSAFIAEVNRMKRDEPLLNEEGPQMKLGDGDSVIALKRTREHAGDWTVALINPGAERKTAAPGAVGQGLAGDLMRAAEITPGADAHKRWDGGLITLGPFEVRVFAGGVRNETQPSRETRVRSDEDSPLSSVRSKPIVVQDVYPELDCGRYPVKRVVGDTFAVWADIFREGHGRLGAVLKIRRAADDSWTEVPMTRVNPGLDRWTASFPLAGNTRYRYTVEAWADHYESWREELEKKRAAGQDVHLDLIEGRSLVEEHSRGADKDSRDLIERTLRDFDKQGPEQQAALLTSEHVRGILAKFPDRREGVVYDHELEVVVDRPRARFGAWYEMIPRSQGTDPGRSATFTEAARRIPEIADMGFDVIYMPPIHPIGRTNRKGPNNSLVAPPGAPGSLYAIGDETGGHTAVHPDLGTIEDFRAFVAECRAHDMEVALDFAVQCSPDHPWIKEHPDWFVFRPDGTIKFAENPPKKYEDIVNPNFHGPARDEIMRALRDVIEFWIAQGVKIFRVDNPHTKPIPFWEWLIGDVQSRHPETIFLSEAFTRPRVLEMLAKIGFTQSYTYFTWRNTKQELADYATELTRHFTKEYLRPNFFTNTPDINPPFLQTGGRPAFQIRLVLAATLSTTYGIYNGFELCEAARGPGPEDYADSEKYQYKVWDWDRPGNIKDYISRLNRIRRENPALQLFENLAFHPAGDDEVLFYGKTTPDRSNIVFVALTLDPHEPREAEIVLPLAGLGIAEDRDFRMEELLSGRVFFWKGSRQVIRFDPSADPAFIFRLTPPA